MNAGRSKLIFLQAWRCSSPRHWLSKSRLDYVLSPTAVPKGQCCGSAILSTCGPLENRISAQRFSYTHGHPWKLFTVQFPIHVVVLHARARLKSFMAGQLTQRPYWYVPPLIMFDVGISCSHSFKLLRSAAFSKTGGCNLLSGAFLCQARNYKLKLLNRDTFQDLFFE